VDLRTFVSFQFHSVSVPGIATFVTRAYKDAHGKLQFLMRDSDANWEANTSGLTLLKICLQFCTANHYFKFHTPEIIGFCVSDKQEKFK